MELVLMILLVSTLSTADDPELQGCSVSAVEGGTVILPVKVDLPENSELPKPTIWWWTNNKEKVHQYRTNKDYNENQVQRFKGRTSLFKEEIINGNVSLKIINITKSDEGNYICKVHHNNPDIVKTDSVYLCVLEKGEEPVIVLAIIGGLIALVGLVIFSYKKCKRPKSITDQTALDVNPMMDNGEGDFRDGEDSDSL